MSEWIEHDGKGMPVEPTVEVDVRYRDGDEDFAILARSCGPHGDGDECWWSWHGDRMTNVTHWRLHTLPEWISHDGNSMPVPSETIVDVMFPDAEGRDGWSAGFWHGSGGGNSNWVWPDGIIQGSRICAYRVREDKTDA